MTTRTKIALVGAAAVLGWVMFRKRNALPKTEQIQPPVAPLPPPEPVLASTRGFVPAPPTIQTPAVLPPDFFRTSTSGRL